MAPSKTVAEPKQQKSNKRTAGKKNSSKKKNFSSFTRREAFKQLAIKELTPWVAPIEPQPAGDFFQERLARLRRNFDLESCEESKKLIIDAVCEEVLERHDRLRIWKGASLEGQNTAGVADYLVAERQGYLEAPFLCIIEAKKDDFEQGAAQCLVEMQACQWENQQVNRSIDILGIVTNGNAWAFYQLTVQNQVYATDLYALSDVETVLGWLQYVFDLCDRNLGA
jgi:hypothetical protein